MKNLKGIIPNNLTFDHQGRLTYSEERLLEAFLIYTGNVERELKTEDFHEEAMARALARMMFLLEPDAVARAIDLHAKGSAILLAHTLCQN